MLDQTAPGENINTAPAPRRARKLLKMLLPPILVETARALRR